MINGGELNRNAAVSSCYYGDQMWSIASILGCQADQCTPDILNRSMAHVVCHGEDEKGWYLDVCPHLVFGN